MSHQRRTAQSSCTLALVPPRHSELPVCVLVPGKHFVGSDDGCHIRLEADGVQPRHALIIVGDQKILLKAIDSRTWVNDHSVSETVLRPGDRVSFGPITFTVRFASSEELREVPAPFEREAPSIPPIEIAAEKTVPPIPAETRVEQILPLNLTVLKAGFTGIAPVDKTSLPLKQETSFEVIQNELEAFSPRSKGFNEEPDSTHLSASQELWDARENELKLLMDELTSQSKQLGTRSVRLSSLEAELEQKQTQLAQDNERLVKAAQEAQQRLADECARQMSLWKEWDAAYQQSKAELNAQFEAIERQREAIRSENELLDMKRDELQRIQFDFEKLQREVTSEKVQAAEDLAKLQADRAAFETERRLHLANLQEQDAKIADQRRGLHAAQDELRAMRQQVESARASFAAEQSAELRRREVEIQEHASVKSRLQETESALNSLKTSLESQSLALDQERILLDRAREEFESNRAELQAERLSFEQNRLEIHRAGELAHESHQHQAVNENDDLRRQMDLEAWQKELEALQAQLEATKDTIRLEQQALEATRTQLDRSAFTSNYDSSFANSKDSHNLDEKDDNWSPISDTVEQLLDIYGVNPSAPPESIGSAPSKSNMDLGSAAITTPIQFPQAMAMTESESRKSHERLRPDFQEAYQLVQRQDSVLMTSNSLAGHHLADLSEIDQSDFLQTENSPSEGEFSRSSGVEIGDSTSAFLADEPIREVVDTLSDVNLRFGYFASGANQTHHISTDETRPVYVAEVPADSQPDLNNSGHPTDHQVNDTEDRNSTAGDSADPLANLRTKLAQMFDLQIDGNSQIDSEDYSRVETSNDSSDSTGHSCVEENLLESFESFSSETSIRDREECPLSQIVTPPEPLQSSFDAASPAETTFNPSTDVDTAESDNEENAWTRRLRELASVAQVAQPSPPPAPKADVTPTGTDESETIGEDDEFSVEAQLARLLGRPLSKSTQQSENPSPKAASTVEHASQVSADPPHVEPADDDRSHLSAAPKHKQDKNAVREEVQSFRAVAQMSARKALEKHSWNNFKNEFYFSSILLTISCAASAWYIAAVCYGFESAPWKAIACIVTSIICGTKLLRLLSRLNMLRMTNSARLKSK